MIFDGCPGEPKAEEPWLVEGNLVDPLSSFYESIRMQELIRDTKYNIKMQE